MIILIRSYALYFHFLTFLYISSVNFSYADVGEVYGYTTDPTVFNRVTIANSGMYKASMMWNDEDEDRVIRVTRSDGTVFEFRHERFAGVTDRFGNEIAYSSRTFTDSLGRVVAVTNDGIAVNGETVVTYITEETNNQTVDPNGLFREDNSFVFKTKYALDGQDKITTYHIRSAPTIYVVDDNDEVEVNPFEQTKVMNGYALDYIELATGGEIHYDYTEQMHKISGQADGWNRIHKVSSTYQLKPNDSTKINETHYTYSTTYSDGTTQYSGGDRDKKVGARILTVQYGDLDGYTKTNTYNKRGDLTSTTVASTDSGNQYEIKTQYEYDYTPESTLVPIKITKTTKPSSDSELATTVVEEYTYDERQNVIERKRNGEVVEIAEYQDGWVEEYGLPLSRFVKRGEDDWIGFENVESDGGKTIERSYVATQDDAGDIDKHEYTDYTYTEEGDLASQISGGVTTKFYYEYPAYDDTNPESYSLIKTTKIPKVSDLTDANGTDLAETDISYTETYDVMGNPVKVQDANGNVTQMEYDLLGRQTKVTHPDASTVTVAYDDVANTVISTDEEGRKEKVVFDALGRNYEGYVWDDAWVRVYQNEYSKNSFLITKRLYEDGSLKSTVTYTYHDDGNPYIETTKSGSTTLAKRRYVYYPYYDENISRVDTRIYTTSSGYYTVSQYTDANGFQLYDDLTYDDKTVRQSYTTDLLGNITSVRDFKTNDENGEDATESYLYDQANRLYRVTTPYGYTEDTYDENGVLESTRDARGKYTYYYYNEAGLMTGKKKPVTNGYIYYDYDANGNLMREKTQKNLSGDDTAYDVVEYRYDNRNRLTAAITNPGDAAEVTAYEYDRRGNITKMAQGLSAPGETLDPQTHKITQYGYDALGNPATITDALNRRTVYQYNTLGELVQETDRNGNIKTYQYDGLGRTKQISTGEGDAAQTVSYTYNLIGKPLTMVDNSGTTSYTYSGRGDLLTETRGGVTKTYTYDANGNRLSFVSDVTGTLNYEYDWANRPVEISGESTTTTYTYDANGNVLTEQTTNLSTFVRNITRTYNEVNQISTQVNKVGSATKQSYTATYYANGNLYRMRDNQNSITQTYVYDGAGRLTSESLNSGAEKRYTYDAFGNRSTMQELTSSTVTAQTGYTYDANNRLTRTERTEGSTTSITDYTYDHNGNQLYKLYSTLTPAGTQEETYTLSEVGALADSFTYDAWNRMTSATVDGVTSTYTYDGNGMRQSKTVNGVTTTHIWDGMNIVADRTDSATYVYTHGLTPISMSDGTTKEYYHPNPHGDTVMMSLKDKTITRNYQYDAFGNELTDTANDTNPFRYCGEYWDAETGNIYLRARYYDPSVGRFISEDPHWNVDNMIYGDSLNNANLPSIAAIMQSSNVYAYVRNNPVNRSDLTGKEEHEDRFLLSADDYKLVKAYTDLYHYYNMVGDYTRRDAMRREAVEVRQKKEYRYKFSHGDINGIYIDDYNYAEVPSNEGIIFLVGTVMSEGEAYLQGGENLKNDFIMEILGQIDRSQATSFLSEIQDIVSEGYDDNRKMLKEGDIYIQMVSREEGAVRYDSFFFDSEGQFKFWDRRIEEW